MLYFTNLPLIISQINLTYKISRLNDLYSPNNRQSPEDVLDEGIQPQ